MDRVGPEIPRPVEGHEAHALKLARITCKRFTSPKRKGISEEIDRDDLWSAALLGAAKALARWDPDRGVQFSSYAVSLIRGEILEEMRHQDWLSRKRRQEAREIVRKTGEWPEWAANPFRSLDEPRIYETESGVDDVALHELVPDADVDIEGSVTDRHDWRRLVAWLPAVERYVVWRYIWDGCTLKEIAGEIDRSETRTLQFWQQACSRLAEWARAYGLEEE